MWQTKTFKLVAQSINFHLLTSIIAIEEIKALPLKLFLTFLFLMGFSSNCFISL